MLDINNLKGLAYIRLGHYNKAINCFSIVIDKVNPDFSGEYYSNRGDAFYKLNDYENAKIDWLKAANPSLGYGTYLDHMNEKLKALEHQDYRYLDNDLVT